MKSFINSSIGRKIAMSLSAIFLMIFLIQHLAINITSVFSPELFNSLSHFMGKNPVIQFIAQPILIFGIIFHFLMGIFLEVNNKNATVSQYEKNMPKYNSTWMSRNMILSGLVILAFFILHFYDFWLPEMEYKYIKSLPEDPNRYYHELTHKFKNIYRVIFYCISFVLLSLHLLHGFSSSLKSLGADRNYLNSIKVVGYIYSIIVPFGFCFIAIFHYINSH